MALKNYLSQLGGAGRLEFAAKCATTLGHLRNVSYGYRAASPVLAAAIERESKGAVTRQSLLPDTWKAIWPELTAPRRAAAITAKPRQSNQTAKAA